MADFLDDFSISKLKATNFVIAVKRGFNTSNKAEAKGKYNGVIDGMVLENDMPVSREVMCYERGTKQLKARVWSGSNGKYSIRGLEAGTLYYVVSLDGNSDDVQFNAVAQDLIPAQLITV